MNGSSPSSLCSDLTKSNNMPSAFSTDYCYENIGKKNSQSSDGTQESLQLQKYSWKHNHNEGIKIVDYLNHSANDESELDQNFRKTQVAVCDNGDGKERIDNAAGKDPELTGNYDCEECSEHFSALEDLRKHRVVKHFVREIHSVDVVCTPLVHNSSENGSLVRNVPSLSTNESPKGSTNAAKKNSTNVQRNFTCLTCGKSFRASKPLKEHEVVHTGAREFPCEICGKAFGTRANMKIHLATHSDKKPYVCNVCNATFRQKDSLKVHCRKHSGERPFQCTICKMTFDRNFTLKNHLLTHGDERAYVCVVCGKAFTTRGGLNNHEKLHSRDPTMKKTRKPPSKPGTGNWICDECGKMYSTRSNLKMHQRSHEPSAVTFSCCVCGRVYKHKDSLEVHMRRHTDDRPYSCPTCGRTFYRNWTLKLHILTHTGEKPHKCPLTGCDKAFTQSSSLYNHLQNHNRQTERSKKKGVPSGEGTSLPTITPLSDSVSNTDPLPNSHDLDVESFDFPHNGNSSLSNTVDNIIIPTSIGVNSLQIDSSNTSLTSDHLEVKVGVGEIHSSVINGLNLNGLSASEISLIQRNAEHIMPPSHVPQSVHSDDALGPICHTDVSSGLVWENVLPMGLNNICGPDQPQTAQHPNPSPLLPVSQSLDQSLYLMSSENVPLLASVDGHLYQQDLQVKIANSLHHFVPQLN